MDRKFYDYQKVERLKSRAYNTIRAERLGNASARRIAESVAVGFMQKGDRNLAGHFDALIVYYGRMNRKALEERPRVGRVYTAGTFYTQRKDILRIKGLQVAERAVQAFFDEFQPYYREILEEESRWERAEIQVGSRRMIDEQCVGFAFDFPFHLGHNLEIIVDDSERKGTFGIIGGAE